MEYLRCRFVCQIMYRCLGVDYKADTDLQRENSDQESRDDDTDEGESVDVVEEYGRLRFPNRSESEGSRQERGSACFERTNYVY